jgi:hypothetical protein
MSDKIVSIHNIMPDAMGVIIRYDSEKITAGDIDDIRESLRIFGDDARFPILVMPESLRAYSVNDLERMREIANELINNAIKEKK